MAKRKFLIPIIIAVLLLVGVGIYICITHLTGNFGQKLETPAEVEIWYVKGEVPEGFDSYVDRYNTECSENSNVTVTAQAFESNSEIVTAVEEAVNGNGQLPNIIMCDPNYGAYLKSIDQLADMNQYFEDSQISDYDDDLVDACTYEDGLVCLPIAWETDVLMVNKKLFSDASAVSSFEELRGIANEYYGENKTSFMTITDYAAFFNMGMTQLGERFNAEDPFECDSDNVRYIYDLLATAAYMRGYTAVGESPAEAVAKGEFACAVVSSSEIMAAAENSDMKNIEFVPVPSMEKGQNVYTREIVGMSILKSDSNSEKGASIFINWFSSKDISSEYVGDSGFVAALPAAVDLNSGETEICSRLIKVCTDLDYSAYNANPDYVENYYTFNKIMDNIMNNSLS